MNFLSPTITGNPVASAAAPVDPAAPVYAAALRLLPHLESGRRVDAVVLRVAMEASFGASDTSGAWDWKTAYDACEAATVLFLRKYGRSLLRKAGSVASTLPLLSRIADLLPTHSFLSMPLTNEPKDRREQAVPAAGGSPEAARRLVSMSQPIPGTLVETYLRGRAITALHETGSLRFHPCCYYRPESGATETWPAMIATVTDLRGKLTGAHRTWLDPGGFSEAHLGRAPIDTPRRAMGELLGHAVRFGCCRDVMAAGEGIETMLSQRTVLLAMPALAALSAAHLSAILFPDTLRRLYIARDNDPAGDAAVATLIERTSAAGIEAMVLRPKLGDFNEDLRLLGADALRGILHVQIAPQDVERFMKLAA